MSSPNGSMRPGGRATAEEPTRTATTATTMRMRKRLDKIVDLCRVAFRYAAASSCGATTTKRQRRRRRREDSGGNVVPDIVLPLLANVTNRLIEIASIGSAARTLQLFLGLRQCYADDENADDNDDSTADAEAVVANNDDSPLLNFTAFPKLYQSAVPFHPLSGEGSGEGYDSAATILGDVFYQREGEGETGVLRSSLPESTFERTMTGMDGTYGRSRRGTASPSFSFGGGT